MSALSSRVYSGTSLVPGVALGPVRLLGFEGTAERPARIAADEVEEELNALRGAVERSREQISSLRTRHADTLGESELRIFDVHVALLDDPMFTASLEKLVMEERYSVRAAIARVSADYERIFELVEDTNLRERAGDFRDVADRVLRNLPTGSRPPGVGPAELPEGGRYVLVARRLTVNDLFRIDDERVEGIIAEEGGISSHAGILARSMGIPTITGIDDLASKLRDDDFVVLDATAGELHVDPDDRLRAEFEAAAAQYRKATVRAPILAEPHQLRDGQKVRVRGVCGNLAETELADSFGMDGVGVYRSELMFLVEQRKPTEDVLVHHYQQVLLAANEGKRPVWFRLLDVASNARIDWLHSPQAERNPALGLRGIRSLLQEGDALRLQLRAVLRAAAGRKDIAVLVPFVTSVLDVQRVRAIVLEERLALRRRGVDCASTLGIAPIIEVPAAAFAGRALLNESDFAVIALDDLQALLLAADRDNGSVRDYYRMHHPASFELGQRLAEDAEATGKNVVLFGELAAVPELLSYFVGVGFRDFAVAPAHAAMVLGTLRQLTAGESRKVAEQVLQAPRAMDVERVLLKSAPKLDPRAVGRPTPSE